MIKRNWLYTKPRGHDSVRDKSTLGLEKLPIGCPPTYALSITNQALARYFVCPAKCPGREEKEGKALAMRVGEGVFQICLVIRAGLLISFHAVDVAGCSHASRCQPGSGILISHYENSLAPQQWVLHCWSLALCSVPWQWSQTGCPKLSHPW